MKRIVIVGGGITGLSAAYTIQEALRGNPDAQVDYLLLERERHLGGKLLTEKIDGFTIEGGPDCFLSEKPWVAQLSARIGIEDRLLPSNEESKGTFVLSGGKLHPLPEGLMLMVPTKIIPFAMSSLISWPGKLRMAVDYVIPRKKDDADESLADFVIRRLGREALDKIAEPLIGGIHSADAELMSLKASFPRFIKMEQEHGSLIKAMLAARNKAAAGVPRTAGTPRRTYFMSFVDGMGELPNSVAAQLDRSKILTGKQVVRLEKRVSGEGTSYVVHVHGEEPIEAGAVIVAALAGDASYLVAGIDGALAAKIGEIPMASSATISLAYRRADVHRRLEGFGFVIPKSENRRIMAVTYSSTKWDYRIPDDDHVLLRAFVGGAKNQNLVLLDDREMTRLVRGELAHILGITAEPVLVRIYRWIRGMSQYTLGHLERMDGVESVLAGHPGLFLAGGSYRGVGIGDCINLGTKAAEGALAYLGRTP